MCRTGVEVFLNLRLNERRLGKIFTTGREPERLEISTVKI